MRAADIAADDVADLLRDSLRGLLDQHWCARSSKDAASTEAVSAIWHKLVRQGITALGADPEEGGLREILVVFEELGRAACPAPMWSGVLANRVLAGVNSGKVAEMRKALRDGGACTAFSFGAFDPDPGVGSIELHGTAASDRSASSRQQAAPRICLYWLTSCNLHLSTWRRPASPECPRVRSGPGAIGN